MTMETYHWECQHLTDPPTTSRSCERYRTVTGWCGARIGRFLQSSPLNMTDLSLRCVRQTNWGKPTATMTARYPAAVGGCRCHRNLKANPHARSTRPARFHSTQDGSHFVSFAWRTSTSSAFTIRYLLLSGIERSLSHTNAQ
jgi:hypothetical protein